MTPQLPFDILIAIADIFPAFRDFEGEIITQTMARCAQVSTMFRDAFCTPSLWERHYRVRYHYAEEGSELQRRSQFGDNWRLLYSARRIIDNDALLLLDKIVEKRRGRYDHATALARMCLDAWDVLDLCASRCKSPLVFCSPEDRPDVSLTREFWATTLKKAILRTYAVRLWSCLNLQGSDTVSFVEAMNATSCFTGQDPQEVRSLLSSLAFQCREYLQARKCPMKSDEPNYSLPHLCSQVCEFLRDQGFGPVEAPHFHDMMNLYPHSYLTTHKRTIPLSLVHIFVSVATSLGVAASPVDFPMRVLAHVSSPDPTMDDFYVDVYGSNEKAILSARDDIPVLLLRQGITSIIDYISPCLAQPMLLRTGRNLLASLRTASRVSSNVAKDSILLAFSLHILFTRRVPLISQMFTQVNALDVATFIGEALVPGVGQYHIQHSLSAACQEVMDQETKEAAIVRLRSQEETSIQHFVGLVFKHKIYNYLGCIYGWDPMCLATDDWMTEMGVHNLTRGKDQPFYPSFCMDGQMRYVAEDNIQPLLNFDRDIFTKFKDETEFLPRYFTGVTINETWAGHSRGRFALSPELLVSYPEDDTIGQAWVELPPPMSQVK